METVVFRSLNKNLRLIMEAPYREPFQNGMWKDHNGRYHQFKNGYLKTEDEKEISELKAHRLFSEVADMPGKFWVYIAPVNLQDIIDQKDVEIAALKEVLAEKEAEKEAKKNLKKSKAVEPEPEAAPSASVTA